MLKSFFATFAIFALLCTGAFAQGKSSASSTEKQPAKTRAESQPANIQKAQETLKSKGLYKGEVTGKMDAATKDAVKSFQKQEGLNPTGHLNKDTRVKLGIESADGATQKKISNKKSKKTGDNTSAAGEKK
jgi:peptidoglycan hydrolase-like protein with peptidoglycan-binding domain